MAQVARTDLQDGFVFRGGVLALELINTAIEVRGKPVDLLATPDDLGRWWAICQERYPAEAVETTKEALDLTPLEPVKILRGALRRLCEAITRAEPPAAPDLASLNAALGLAHLSLSDGLQSTYRCVPGGSPLLFHVARSAHTLFSERDLSRLHKCHHERCVLYFYDSTKSRTRQWCSLDCQNRARSSRNYRQRQAAVQPEGG